MINNKIESIINIYNILLEEKWINDVDVNDSIFYYLFSVGLIEKPELQKFSEFSVKLSSNPLINRFFQNIDYFWNPKNYKNQTVADIGSGYGYLTFWLLLSGAKKVLTVGDPKRIDFIKRLYDAACKRNLLKPNSIIFKPEFIRAGDRTLANPIKNKELSLVLLNDTLEHISPSILPSLLLSAYNNLQDNGLFISKQHNTDSPRVKNLCFTFWQETEENKFMSMRKSKIIELVPNIELSNLDSLVLATQGLDTLSFNNVIDNFLNTSYIPEIPNTTRPAINIENDEVAEGETNIEFIVEELKKAGFRTVKVYPAMLESRRSKFLQPLAKLIPGPFLKFHIFDQTTVFEAIK